MVAAVREMNETMDSTGEWPQPRAGWSRVPAASPNFRRSCLSSSASPGFGPVGEPGVRAAPSCHLPARLAHAVPVGARLTFVERVGRKESFELKLSLGLSKPCRSESWV